MKDVCTGGLAHLPGVAALFPVSHRRHPASTGKNTLFCSCIEILTIGDFMAIGNLT